MRARTALLAAAVAAAGILYFELQASTAPAEAPSGSVLIAGVPHVLQEPDFCGEACAEMYLKKLGEPHTQDDVFNLAAVDPAKGMGSVTKNLKWALDRIGFATGTGWFEVAADSKAVEPQWKALLADLHRGVPSIVCMHYDESPKATEHFRLVLGYDAKTDEVIYHEPAVADGAYRRMTRARFFRLWPLPYEADQWTLIRLRLEVRRIRPPKRLPEGVRYSDADFAQHVMELRKRLPEEKFTIVVAKPFVVIGDEPAALVRRRAAGTVAWAARKLKQSYFEVDPLEILDVWLFRDRGSYLRNARKLFGDTPDTPFGYYSSPHRALVMNIATGGGTLVHEIVHPFVEANFPGCPPWFNEGLGSLYEQCTERGGKIVGLTNWRLKGLQKAIRAEGLPTFEELTGMDAAGFYGGASGDNYGQARYLCYYLQERGLLRRYYRAFHAARKADPTGYRTLRGVLGTKDMKAFQSTWEKWVLGLRFP